MFHATQRVGEVLDWGIDWRPILEGATYTSSTWTATPSEGLTMMDATLGSTQATITLSSDQSGSIFIIENEITTSDGDTLNERIELYVEP